MEKKKKNNNNEIDTRINRNYNSPGVIFIEPSAFFKPYNTVR